MDENCKYIVTADADGQHKAYDVEKIMNQLATGKYLAVHGVRDFGNNIPAGKKLTNLLSKLIFIVLYGINIPDPTSGLRGYASNLAPYVKFESGHEYIVGANRLLAKFKDYLGFAIIDAIYTDYSLKKGLNFWKGMEMFKVMFISRARELTRPSQQMTSLLRLTARDLQRLSLSLK